MNVPSAAAALARIDRLLEAASPETVRAFVERQAPATARAGLLVVALLEEALPPTQQGLPRRALLADVLGVGGRGGVPGILRRVLEAVDDGAPAAARTLMAQVEAVAYRHPAPAVAQALASLQALAGPESAAEAAELLLTRAAGLVIVAPYLPRLFDRLGLLHQSALAPEAADRAMDALHSVLHGATEASPDGRVLERLFCGLPPDAAVRPPSPLDPEAADVVEAMLGAVAAEWSALGKTSVAGLREAFLRRDGLVRPADAGWSLEVSPRAYDMLLDRLPWSISLVKLRWMVAPLHVKWRK